MITQPLRCRGCGATAYSDQDFCIVCGICLFTPTTLSPAGAKSITYAAVMDEETCPACRANEARTAKDINRLMPIPNPRCNSLLGCRCFHIYE